MAGLESAVARVRDIALDLPETTERLSHGMVTFFVRDKRTFVNVADNVHGDGRFALWVAAPPGVQEQLIDREPDRFFVPPYVGPRGWLGVRLDVDVDWDEVAAIIEEAYRHVAPATLVRRLDEHS